MKKLLFILVLCLIGRSGFSQVEKEPIEKTECYYVYIDRVSPETNNVKGQNEKGDVLDVVPCDKITPPEHDFKNFNIIKMKLTISQKADLMKPLLSTDKNESGEFIRLKERAIKLDSSLLTEKKEYTKDEISQSLTIKPIDAVSK